MAIAITTLTVGGDPTDATSYALASVNVTAGRVRILALHGAKSADPDLPVPVGFGDTWTLQNDHTFGFAGKRVVLYTGYTAAPSNGVVTVTCAGATQVGMLWALAEIAGCDVSLPIVQSTCTSTSGVTSQSVTLAAFATTDNVGFGVGGSGHNLAMGAAAGFTSIGSAVLTAPNMGIVAEYLANTPTIGASTASNIAIAVIGAEISVTVAAAGAPKFLPEALGFQSLKGGMGLSAMLEWVAAYAKAMGRIHSRVDLGSVFRIGGLHGARS